LGAAAGVAAAPAYRGTLTFSATGPGDPFGPSVVEELDLSSNQLGLLFDGLSATRTRSGETAFISRLGAGYYADHGIVVADARGVPGAPLHVCKQFHYSSNVVCSTPKLARDGKQVAFAIAGSGTLCKNNYDMFWGDHVIVSDRRGAELARFEGFYAPEWLPDGRLLLMGSMCRNAGVWLTDASLRNVTRVDDNQVATPAGAPAISPDGKLLAFVWNKQLWSLTLDGRAQLQRLTQLPHAVASAAWSPDGSALALLQFDVSMPLRSVILMRPADPSSIVVRQLPVYPYGPTQRQPGSGIRVCRGRLRAGPAENGPIHEAKAEPVHGTNATNRYVGWPAGSPDGYSG
jgi:hypothetical protein